MVAHAFNLTTQEVYTEEGYHKCEASLSYIPDQDSGVVALRAMRTIKASSEEKEVGGRISESRNDLRA